MNEMPFEGGEFESWLEDGLGKALNAQSGPSPLAGQASYHAAFLSGGVGVSLSSSIAAAVTSKVAIGGATAALIVGGGTAVAAGTASGSANPAAWGQFISKQVVPMCKAKADSAGVHGIGSCVSTFARLHGEEVSSEARHHGATEAREHGKANAAPGHEEATEGRKNGAENGRPSNGTGKPGDTGKPPSGTGDHGAPPKS